MRFEPSRDMKITLLPEQKDQLCTRETIREVFSQDDKGECMAFDIYDGEAMVGFAMFCQYPEGHYAVKEFTTTYVWGNEIARRLYASVGFAETDVVEEEDYKEVNMIYRIE